MSIRPTAFGLKAIAFYVVVCTAYFASPYTNLFFLLLTFLSVLLLLNIWWTIHNVLRLRATVTDVDPFAAGAIDECEIRVDPGGRPRLRVQVEATVDRKHYVLSHLPILDGEAVVLRGKLPRLRRGIHEVTSWSVTSTYPLGLAHATRSVEGPKRLVVYPEPLQEQLLDVGGLVAGGETPSGDIGGAASTETASLREYRDGDSTRNVHWRASARNARTLVVREFEPCTDAAIEVVLDRRCSDEEFERALSAVTRLALLSVELDQPIVLRTQQFAGTFGAGNDALLDLWKWLAIASPIADDDAPPPSADTHDAVHLPRALNRLGKEQR